MKHQLSAKRLTRIILFSALLSSIFFYACKKKDKEDDTDTSEHKMKTFSAKIQQVYTDTIVTGTVSLSQHDEGEVSLTLDITVPSRANKSVAVHIHAMNDCGGNATNAMGHWNPTGSKHGKFGSSAFHAGDIGNISLDAKGRATYTITTNIWTLGGSDTTRNIVNRSIIIHSGVDDYTTQPSGNSGNRIGCVGIDNFVVQ
jgi:Cu-Zn family superoxide dismutase